MGGFSFLHFLIIIFLLAPFSSAFSKQDCGEFVAEVAAIQSSLDPANLEDHSLILENYKFWLQQPEFAALFPPDEVTPLFADYENAYYLSVFDKVLHRLFSDRTQATVHRKTLKAVARVLKGLVPVHSIDARLAALEAHEGDAVLRALGENSREDMHEMLYGKNLRSPSPESLVGQYLAETGAATLLKRFPIRPGGKQLGPTRLVIAFSEATLPALRKYFSRPEFLSIVGHARMVHEMNVVGINFADFRLPHEYTPLPWVVLKTSEGQRTKRYFEFFKTFGGGWNHICTKPWLLPGYCAQGGYQCCTNWIGNIPIGDKLVKSYTFPGRVESGQKPRKRVLRPYESDNPLVHRVWTVPGHEQFSEVIEQGDKNLKGEFASTGFVFNTLLGPTKTKYVPIVLLSTPDHRQPIPEDFAPHYERPF